MRGGSTIIAELSTRSRRRTPVARRSQARQSARCSRNACSSSPARVRISSVMSSHRMTGLRGGGERERQALFATTNMALDRIQRQVHDFSNILVAHFVEVVER